MLYIQGFTIKFHSLSIVPISLFSTVTLGHFLSHKLGSCVGLPEKNIAQFSRITFRILNLSACFMLFTHSVSLCLKLNGYFLIRDYKTAKFQSWRSEKKILPLCPICTTRVWPGFESQILFVSPTLISGSLAAP